MDNPWGLGGKNPWKKYHDPEIVGYLNRVQLNKIKF